MAQTRIETNRMVKVCNACLPLRFVSWDGDDDAGDGDDKASDDVHDASDDDDDDAGHF